MALRRFTTKMAAPIASRPIVAGSGTDGAKPVAKPSAIAIEHSPNTQSDIIAIRTFADMAASLSQLAGSGERHLKLTIAIIIEIAYLSSESCTIYAINLVRTKTFRVPAR